MITNERFSELVNMALEASKESFGSFAPILSHLIIADSIENGAHKLADSIERGLQKNER